MLAASCMAIHKTKYLPSLYQLSTSEYFSYWLYDTVVAVAQQEDTIIIVSENQDAYI